MSIVSGDSVLLLSSDEKTFLVNIREGKTLSTHIGILNLGDAIGKNYGDAIFTKLGKPYYLLDPTLEDKMMKVKRLTQIIYPKDAALILLKTGVHYGCRVIECGVGSGALTIALATAVYPNGRVYAYDRREDFLENARKNVGDAGLGDMVDFKLRDVNEGFDEEGMDIAVLDLPSPWEGIPSAYRSIRGGGRIASISPTFNQVEQTVMTLRKENFVYIETIEVLIRPLLVRTGKTRPYERMVSHTGFLTFGRKINGVN